jgi:3-oxoacyl-[acyl-carrier-protein] synthase-3
MKPIGIIGTGKKIPTKKIDNSFISNKTKTDPNWILERTGIKTRYFINNNENISMLSFEASKIAIKNAGIKVEEIDLIIGCTFSSEYRFPGLAVKINQLLKISKSGCFDISGNCTGFQMALDIAVEKINYSKNINYILVVGATVQSPFINWKSLETSMYFGDGAGAAVVGRVPNGYGHLSSYLLTNSKVYDDVRLVGGGSKLHSKYYNKRNFDKFYYEMSGIETWKQVITYQPSVIKKALEYAKLSLNDVDFFIFHQANKILIEYLMGKLKIPLNKTYSNVSKYGNTADASLAIALDDALKKKKINRGDIVVISGVGAGFIFGATIFKWY